VSLRRVIVVVMLGAVLLGGGCAGLTGAGRPAGAVGSISAYGITVYRDSRPRQVAELFIAALDDEAEEILRCLIAGKAEKHKLDKFARARGRPKATVEEAVDLAVAGWLASYSYFRKGRTSVTGEKVSRSEATVYAEGAYGAAGQKRAIEITMVREDGWWKVTGGPKSVRE